MIKLLKMAEVRLENQHLNEGTDKEEIDEPDSAFIINKNFKGVHKKFKGPDINTDKMDSPNSIPSSENEFETWHTTSFKSYAVSPKFQTNSDVMLNDAGKSYQNQYYRWASYNLTLFKIHNN